MPATDDLTGTELADLHRSALGAANPLGVATGLAGGTNGKVDWGSVASSAVVGGITGAVTGGKAGKKAPCGKHSFDPKTAVLMADGSTKKIEDIKVGDEVAATDPATGATQPKPVTTLWLNHDTDLTDVTVKVKSAEPLQSSAAAKSAPSAKSDDSGKASHAAKTGALLVAAATMAAATTTVSAHDTAPAVPGPDHQHLGQRRRPRAGPRAEDRRRRHRRGHRGPQLHQRAGHARPHRRRHFTNPPHLRRRAALIDPPRAEPLSEVDRVSATSNVLSSSATPAGVREAHVEHATAVVTAAAAGTGAPVRPSGPGIDAVLLAGRLRIPVGCQPNARGVHLSVRFRLLGSLEADIGGQLVDLGHGRQRSVLAVLLADANTVVSVNQLLERVWADRPPQRARNTLYSYLSRLRQALRVAGEAGPHRRSGGYVLAVDPSAVDLVQFHRLVMSARTADDGSALALFDQALALWRGEAFAGLNSPWLGALRDQLSQHRFAVELDRNDVALRRGRHAELLPGLAAQARAYPLDERLAGQLMLALYRSGRQADALGHYERTRRLLVEELGADPGPALRELHQRILTEDAAFASPAIAGSEPRAMAPPVPRQLPAPPRLFVGRSRELARLTEVFGSRPGSEHTMPIVTITGTGGIGKTWLALRWAHDNLHRFPDGQLYLNLHGFSRSDRRQPPATAIRSLLEALAAAPSAISSDLHDQTALYRSLVADKRMLIMLDNAYDADQVRPLLPGSAGCAVVVTSRNQLPGLVATDGAQPLPLQVLAPAAARDLLTRRLSLEPAADRPAADRPSVDRIVTACAGLPLALSIVAARAATNPAVPLGTLADDLVRNHGTLDAFAGGDPDADLRAVFSWSYHALDADAARVFRLLGVHPGPTVTAPAVASLAGLTGGRARSLLEDVVRANMAVLLTAGRYALHDLLRTYATELVETDDDRQVALHRMLDHYLHTAYAAALLIEPHREPISLPPARPGVTAEQFTGQAEALEWFVAEQAVILTAVDLAAEAGYDGHAWRLAWATATFLSRGARWQDLTATQRIALASAERARDLVGQAHAHRDLALACNHTGRPEDATAHLQRAFDLFGELGDHIGQAYVCLFLGWVCEWQGRQRGALRHDERALALFQAAGHKVGQAMALNAVGWDHAQAGDHRQAISYCQLALALHEALDNRTGAAKTWDSLGYAHQRLGRHEPAIECFGHALALYRSTGDRYGEAETLDHLGDSHHACGDLEAARSAWQRALDRLGEQSPSEADQIRGKLRRPAARPARP